MHLKASLLTDVLLSTPNADGGEHTIINTLASTVHLNSDEMLTESVRGGNVTICIESLFIANSTTNGDFFHTGDSFACRSCSVFHISQIIQISDIVNMPIHSTASLSLSPSSSASVWSNTRGSDLAGAPCINNCMNITVLASSGSRRTLFWVTFNWEELKSGGAVSKRDEDLQRGVYDWILEKLIKACRKYTLCQIQLPENLRPLLCLYVW